MKTSLSFSDDSQYSDYIPDISDFSDVQTMPTPIRTNNPPIKTVEHDSKDFFDGMSEETFLNSDKFNDEMRKRSKKANVDINIESENDFIIKGNQIADNDNNIELDLLSSHFSENENKKQFNVLRAADQNYQLQIEEGSFNLINYCNNVSISRDILIPFEFITHNDKLCYNRAVFQRYLRNFEIMNGIKNRI